MFEDSWQRCGTVLLAAGIAITVILWFALGTGATAVLGVLLAWSLMAFWGASLALVLDAIRGKP